MLTVVAAIIEREGKLLICQRRRDAALPLKWEFPGGKVQSGEMPVAALARELLEELGVRATIGEERYRTQHKYAEMSDTVELIFFPATIAEQAPRNLAFEQIVWAEPRALPHYDFLEADREVVSRLAGGA
jgi:8-oxo-dGTP diphosphatase